MSDIYPKAATVGSLSLSAYLSEHGFFAVILDTTSKVTILSVPFLCLQRESITEIVRLGEQRRRPTRLPGL